MMPPVSTADPPEVKPFSKSESDVTDAPVLITVPAPPEVDMEMVSEEVPTFPVRPMTVEQYEYLVDIGFYGSDRVEMLDGFVVNKMPHGDLACSIIEFLYDILRTRFGTDVSVRCQLPIRLDSSAPEPDLTVSIGPRERYREGKPTPSDIFLLMEVSDSTLGNDRRVKLRTYARSAIREYWIVNCVDRQIEIYTEPKAADGKPRYATKIVVPQEGTAVVRVPSQAPIEIPLATLFGE